jgi:hypothetical protein
VEEDKAHVDTQSTVLSRRRTCPVDISRREYQGRRKKQETSPSFSQKNRGNGDHYESCLSTDSQAPSGAVSRVWLQTSVGRYAGCKVPVDRRRRQWREGLGVATLAASSLNRSSLVSGPRGPTSERVSISHLKPITPDPSRES